MNSLIKFRVWDGEKMLIPGLESYVAIGAVCWGFWSEGALLSHSLD